MPYWSIQCIYCFGLIADALLECVPASDRADAAFWHLYKLVPSQGLHRPVHTAGGCWVSMTMVNCKLPKLAGPSFAMPGRNWRQRSLRMANRP